ncbi:MAG: pilus assembly protein [Clostridiales bacterium]|nr:pilus assembly protein [Clostridiales bacterium]
MSLRRGKEGSLAGDTEGSLTVEAMLILPILFLLLALFIRWAWILHGEIQQTAAQRRAIRRVDTQGGLLEEEGAQIREGTLEIAQEKGLAFLYGSLPARRIRDADLLVDIGNGIREWLPSWLQSGKESS